MGPNRSRKILEGKEVGPEGKLGLLFYHLAVSEAALPVHTCPSTANISRAPVTSRASCSQSLPARDTLVVLQRRHGA